MNNLEKNIGAEGSHIPAFTPMDSGAYAKEHLQKITDFNNKIAAQEAALAKLSERMMSPTISSKDTLRELMEEAKTEIARLKDKRDNLHLDKTVH